MEDAWHLDLGGGFWLEQLANVFHVTENECIPLTHAHAQSGCYSYLKFVTIRVMNRLLCAT